MRTTLPIVASGLVALATLGLLALPEYVRPPLVSVDQGAPGLELVSFKDPRRPVPDVPEPLPPAATGGPKASAVYKNVKLLGDLSQAEFDRTMVTMTQWIAPKEGCAFCHDLAKGYQDDGLWTHKVALQQISMTKALNAEMGNHLAPTGVTCYTCHRGEAVPARIWYRQPEPARIGSLIGQPRAWQTNAPTIRQFFPNEPYERWLLGNEDTHVMAKAALPGEPGSGVSSEVKAENLYILMMQMADALGVNCGFCHNSRNLNDWNESTPYRLVGWWAMGNTRDINTKWMEPLAALLPQQQLGVMGDAGKVECGTCHVGHEKPLGGFNLLQHYPAFGPAGGLTMSAADQRIRDIARPIEVQGPAYDPVAKAVAVEIPPSPPATGEGSPQPSR